MNKFIQGLLGIMAAIGGAWITVALIEKYGKVEKRYRCPECDNLIKYHENPCPHCTTKLKWSF